MAATQATLRQTATWQRVAQTPSVVADVVVVDRAQVLRHAQREVRRMRHRYRISNNEIGAFTGACPDRTYFSISDLEH